MLRISRTAPTFVLLTVLFLFSALVAAQATTWIGERPAGDVPDWDERTESQHTDGEVSVGLGVSIDSFEHNSGADDELWFTAAMTASSRVGIEYDWYSVDSTNGWLGYHYTLTNLQDDEIRCVFLPWWGSTTGFRFYGGPGTVGEIGRGEYQKVCISTNGFLILDPEAGPSPTPTAIPNTAQPNAIIAPFWTDLVPGVIRIYNGTTEFAVTWESFYDKVNGAYQTFQVILSLESRSETSNKNRIQDRIQFLYGSTTGHSGVVVGIEDFEGTGGEPVVYPGNGHTTVIRWFSRSPEIRHLTIRVLKDSGDERVLWIQDPHMTLGDNIITNATGPTSADEFYQNAFMGGAAIGLGLGGILVKSTLLSGLGVGIGVLLVVQEVDEYVRDQLWVDGLQYDDALPGESEGSVGALAKHDQDMRCFSTGGCWNWPVDAALGVRGRWLLPGSWDSTVTHSLTIKANVTYGYVLGDGQVDIRYVETEVNLTLEPDVGNSMVSALPVSLPYLGTAFLGGLDSDDYYKFYVECGRRISAGMTPRENVNFQLHLYNSAGSLVGSSPGDGGTEALSYNVNDYGKAGNYYLDGHANFGDGLYELSISLSTISCGSGGGGGGGSPFVAPWNGTDYQVDNNILPLSEVFDREEADVVDYYRLQAPLVEKYGVYPLKLMEFEEEHSYLNSVGLLAVDHDPDVSVGVHSQTGEVLTFEPPEAPGSAFDNYGRDVLSALMAWDGDYHEGWRGDYVEVDFGVVPQDSARLVVVADNCNPCIKTRIYVRVWNGTDWELADTMHHRLNFAADVIDMSNYTPSSHLRIRLVGASRFALEQVALDTSPPKPVVVQEAGLLGAVHSSEEDVTAGLSWRDAWYAEMQPGESIHLSFSVPAPSNPDLARSFVLVGYGHYVHRYQPLQGTEVVIDGLSIAMEAIVPTAPVGKYWETEIAGLDWNLGDGTAASGTEITHTYTAPGSYRVAIQVHYTDGGVKSYERVILLGG